ncbi:hypothetical protein [Rhodoflexus sp.]
MIVLITSMIRLLLLFLLQPMLIAAQTAADFREAYASEYQRAESWLRRHLTWQMFTEKHFPVALAAAFPEMVRYNELSNLLETTALELLYVKKGSRAVDFSIGQFQMKPSFIEQLEKMADCPLLTVQQRQWLQLPHLPQQEARSLRIQRLKLPAAQLHYLLIFERIATWRQATQLALCTTRERVKRLAVFYNAGLHISTEQLHYYLQTPLFPYGKRYAGPQYSYADIAWEAYRRLYIQ